MSTLLLLGLIATPTYAQDIACPDGASTRQLKRENTALEQSLTSPAPEPQALDDAFIQVQTQLGCVPELPPSVVARSFLLLGSYYLTQGDEFRAGPFVSAAALLGGESAWLDTLGPDLRVRFYNALATGRPRGVVYAPELLLVGEHHLVGSLGPPPWLMPVGTFTFLWNDRSVPINVNEHELSLVTPRTFDEFEALVEGVTEADLEEPDYDAPVYYDRRAEKKRQREEEQEQREREQEQQESQQDQPDAPSEPAVDANSFFDELAHLEADDTPPPSQVLIPPDEPKVRQGLSTSPHLGLGVSYTITGPASQGSPVGDESFGGLGFQLGAGLTLHLGERLALRPELGFRSAAQAADLDPARFESEGYDGAVPVEPLRNRLLLGYARLPILAELGPLSLGLAPSWSIGSARVTALGACGEQDSCVAPQQGSVMAAGGSLLLGLRPGRSPIVPWLDLGVLHDGERATMAGSLVLAWEGSP
jgi:hypothetical protein